MRSSIPEVMAKFVCGVIIAVIVVLSMIRFEGPGAQQWFAEHPMIHFFYKLIHFMQ